MPPTVDELLPDRLEESDRWPQILAATAVRSVREVAAELDLPVTAISAALRRTKATGKRRLVRRRREQTQAAADAQSARSSGGERSRGAAKPERKQKRRRRRTPGQAKVGKHRDLVGMVPDHRVAEKAGVSVGTVVNYRRTHGIPAAPRRNRADINVAQVPPTAPRRPASEQAPGSVRSAPRRRPTPAQARVARVHDLVGVLPDHQVAGKAGVSVGTVRNYRREHGIPGASRRGRTRKQSSSPTARTATTPTPSPTGGGPAQARVAALHELVGVVHDRDVAARARVSLSSVRTYRLRHSIAAPRRRAQASRLGNAPAGRSSRGATKPTSSSKVGAVSDPTASRELRHVWRVGFGGGVGDRYAMGATLVDAVHVALAAGLGEVVSIELVGKVLLPVSPSPQQG